MGKINWLNPISAHSVEAPPEKVLSNADALFINGMAEAWPDMALDFDSSGGECLDGDGL